MVWAIVKVLPEPVTPISVWNFCPRLIAPVKLVDRLRLIALRRVWTDDLKITHSISPNVRGRLYAGLMVENLVLTSLLQNSLFRFLAIFSAVLVTTFVTFLPLCNLIFSCGCTVAGPSHCNVHHLSGPRCPWCAHGNGVFAIVYAMIMIGVAAGILAALQFKVRRAGLIVAYAAGLISYFLSAGIMGLASALYFHYPTWFGMHLSSSA